MKSVTFNADILEYFLYYLHGCQFKIQTAIHYQSIVWQ